MLPATFQVELIEQSWFSWKENWTRTPSADFCSSAFLGKNLPPFTIMPDSCHYFLAAPTHEQRLQLFARLRHNRSKIRPQIPAERPTTTKNCRHLRWCIHFSIQCQLSQKVKLYFFISDHKLGTLLILSKTLTSGHCIITGFLHRDLCVCL